MFLLANLKIIFNLQLMIGLTTGLVMFVNTIISNPNQTNIKMDDEIATTEIVAPNKNVNALEQTASTTSTILEAYIREYYIDTPILAEIAKCESSFRHLAKNGKVLRGIKNHSDIGVMQINKYYHEKKANGLNLNLYDLDDQLIYAQILYEKEGTAPWNASSKCWKKSLISDCKDTKSCVSNKVSNFVTIKN